MGALAKLLIESEDAINKLGQNPKENDGYNFKVDKDTWSKDDFLIRTDNNNFVLAVTWANPPEGYTPSMPNLAKAFNKMGLSIIPTVELEQLKQKAEKKSK